MSTLPLKPVVDVFYNLGKISSIRTGFNLGAILGTSNVISSATRGLVFDSVDSMIAYGFSSDSAEVQAATVYFAAESKPAQLLVGRWVKVATKASITYNGPISNGNIVTIGSTSYTIGDGTSDTTTLADLATAATTAGASIAQYTSNSLYLVFEAAAAGSEGEPTSLTVAQGAGSEVANTSSKAGEDAETPLAALQALRNSNSEWYSIAFVEELSDANNLAIAAYIESTSNSQPSTYFLQSSSSSVTSGSAGNLFEQLKDSSYSRTIGTATAKPYTHVGIMGYAMGQTRNTANSSYTLGLKSIPGSTPDNYSSQEVSNVEANNGNLYINRGAYYNIYEKGKVFSGAWFDEIIQLDKLCNGLQLDVMDLLTSGPKIPQTNNGMARILATLEKRCQEAVKIGFIAPGQWNGDDVLNLATGDYLTNGYLIQSESFESQSQADRDARIAPYIYIALKLAGAIQSVVIQIDVNR